MSILRIRISLTLALLYSASLFFGLWVIWQTDVEERIRIL